jgi:tryptophanyl-tRNA synthetase
VGELERCPTFKEKVAKNPDNVNLGLFSYPVLMAADILIQKANLVPVGVDQIPHIEMTRVFAKRFNFRYGQEVFPLPEALEERLVRVPGIDGTGKMGKSDGNTIDLAETPEMIRKKIAGAVSDTTRARRTDPGHPFECNLYALHEFVTGEPQVAQIKSDCEGAKIGCVDCKRCLADSIIGYLTPFQERRAEIAQDSNYVSDVLREGGIKARATAIQTVDEVRSLMGLVRF